MQNSPKSRDVPPSIFRNVWRWFSPLSKHSFKRKPSLYFPQKVYFANHNNQLQCFINARESSNRQRETLQSLPFIFTLRFCWDLWTACKSYTWIFQKQLFLAQYLSELCFHYTIKVLDILWQNDHHGYCKISRWNPLQTMNLQKINIFQEY